jgi:hypothetical protein
MIYNWTQLGIKEITNIYLHGSIEIPADLYAKLPIIH